MGWWWLLFYAMREEENKNENKDSSWYGLMTVHENTRFEQFMNRHPVLDRIWPYIIGLFIGIMPVIIMLILNGYLFKFGLEDIGPYIVGLLGGILVWLLLCIVVDKTSDG